MKTTSLLRTLLFFLVIMVTFQVFADKLPMSDSAITSKVKAKISEDKLFGNKDISAWTISVETNNGVITLTGTADSKAQVENAVKLAQSISGVSQVKYRIKITRDHIANYEMKNY